MTNAIVWFRVDEHAIAGQCHRDARNAIRGQRSAKTDKIPVEQELQVEESSERASHVHQDHKNWPELRRHGHGRRQTKGHPQGTGSNLIPFGNKGP